MGGGGEVFSSFFLTKRESKKLSPSLSLPVPLPLPLSLSLSLPLPLPLPLPLSLSLPLPLSLPLSPSPPLFSVSLLSLSAPPLSPLLSSSHSPERADTYPPERTSPNPARTPWGQALPVRAKFFDM